MGSHCKTSFPLTTENALLKEGGMVGSWEGGAGGGAG